MFDLRLDAFYSLAEPSHGIILANQGGHNPFVLSPNREEFLSHQAEDGLVPVTYELLADMETPLSAYWKLAHDQEHSALLESVTGGEQLARYSMIAVDPRAVIRTKDRTVTIRFGDQALTATMAEGEDGLSLLSRHVPKINSRLAADLPKFCGGAVGLLGYELVRSIERLPDANPDELGVDDVAMMICDTVVVFDHAKNVIRIIVLAEPNPQAYDDARRQVEQILARLRRPLPALPSMTYPASPVESNVDQATFERNVDRIREYIAQGDCIQVVPSIRFSTAYEAEPITVYRALRSLNPSPYMYLLRFGDFSVVGASPEILVGLSGREARLRPIAGTRHRGNSPAEDNRLAQELLADEKERAEHIMLVDLGRNDIGRVSAYGSVVVDDLMVIERYSHVMHIVSNVRGQLKDGLDAYDLVRATFPAGTVSGAPKIRAMEIINELEPTTRGLYAGAVGYFSATGDVDLAIAIRTILMKGGRAYVQAGAGIVIDSDPATEYQECVNKAKASLAAIQTAQGGLPQ